MTFSPFTWAANKKGLDRSKNMGCNISYCQEENKINIKETLKASNQYYNTNRKTQRIIEKCKRTYSEITIDRNISDEEESTKKITGEVNILGINGYMGRVREGESRFFKRMRVSSPGCCFFP